MRFAVNVLASRDAYTDEERKVTSRLAAEEALAEVGGWTGYAPTPLRTLEPLARELGLEAILFKDESGRLGQGSFKSLGGAYAAERKVREAGLTAPITLVCATDGNHGRSVAFAAQRLKGKAVVYMHDDAPEDKAVAIRGLGAQVIRMPGTYDDAVRAALATAKANGLTLIADTGDVDDPVVKWVMQGYGVMALELVEQFGETPPTHVLLQGGVGGLAAGIAGVFSDIWGPGRPKIVVVEPDAAGCLFESALQFKPATIGGDLRTAMHMLSTGEASPVAWPVLQKRVDAFVTIGDDAAIDAARRLTSGEAGGEPLDIGVTGAAGLGGLIELMQAPAAVAALGLDASSRVLIIGTEAAPPKLA